MHSRIFQVSQEPINEENLLGEYRYEEDFVGRIADYVAKQTYKGQDYIEDLKWLQEATDGLEVDVEAGTIIVKSKEEYFSEKHDRFMELAEKLSCITLEEFIGEDKFFDMHDLKAAYDDKYSFYIDDNDEYCGLTTLDNWVRNAEENKTYYVGSIFDYHF